MKPYRLLATIMLIGLFLGVVGYCVSSAIVPGGTPAYIANTRTGVFHKQRCSHLPQEKNRAYFDSRKEAIEAGYRPCLKCRP